LRSYAGCTSPVWHTFIFQRLCLPEPISIKENMLVQSHMYSVCQLNSVSARASSQNWYPISSIWKSSKRMRLSNRLMVKWNSPTYEFLFDKMAYYILGSGWIELIPRRRWRIFRKSSKSPLRIKVHRQIPLGYRPIWKHQVSSRLSMEIFKTKSLAKSKLVKSCTKIPIRASIASDYGYIETNGRVSGLFFKRYSSTLHEAVNLQRLSKTGFFWSPRELHFKYLGFSYVSWRRKRQKTQRIRAKGFLNLWNGRKPPEPCGCIWFSHPVSTTK